MSYSDNDNQNSTSDQSMDDLIADLSEPAAKPAASAKPAAPSQPAVSSVPVPDSAPAADPFAQTSDPFAAGSSDPFAAGQQEEGGAFDPFGLSDLVGDAGAASSDAPVAYGAEATPEADVESGSAAIPEAVVAAKRGKKVKGAKVKKAPKVKVPRTLVPWNGACTVLALYIVCLLLGIGAVNAGAFVLYGMDSIIFLIIFDLLALFLVLVPGLLLRRCRYGEYMSFFDVSLGMALSFVVVACMVLLGVQSVKYGMEIKPSGELPVSGVPLSPPMQPVSVPALEGDAGEEAAPAEPLAEMPDSEPSDAAEQPDAAEPVESEAAAPDAEVPAATEDSSGEESDDPFAGEEEQPAP
ncbi:MAG: hypothetical protein Q4G68_09055 [Planctomycetia bacterium]|nr:hypothetical protein [Planctomycetia bacterium]